MPRTIQGYHQSTARAIWYGCGHAESPAFAEAFTARPGKTGTISDCSDQHRVPSAVRGGRTRQNTNTDRPACDGSAANTES